MTWPVWNEVVKVAVRVASPGQQSVAPQSDDDALFVEGGARVAVTGRHLGSRRPRGSAEAVPAVVAQHAQPIQVRIPSHDCAESAFDFGTRTSRCS